MPKFKVFIDGSAGTTGLRIVERLQKRPEIELLTISAEGRKDVNERAKVINSADLAFLCLPDAAAKEVMPLVSENVKILDTSTAHRTAPGWVYGFPELEGQREKIKASNRVAVPGCHASGFISTVAPLVQKGVLPAYFPFTCYSLTGYSGGGKSMIAAYEAPDRPEGYSAPRSYGLTLKHKHLPEMTAVCGLTSAPLFCPIVDDFYSGMQTVVPLRLELVQDVTPEQVAACLADYYQGESQVLVHPLNELPEDKFLTTNLRTGSDKMEIFVVGHESQLLVMSLFDNLGKGSSGAAVQCMNLMLSLPETENPAGPRSLKPYRFSATPTRRLRRREKPNAARYMKSRRTRPC